MGGRARRARHRGHDARYVFLFGPWCGHAAAAAGGRAPRDLYGAAGHHGGGWPPVTGPCGARTRGVGGGGVRWHGRAAPPLPHPHSLSRLAATPGPNGVHTVYGTSTAPGVWLSTWTLAAAPCRRTPPRAARTPLSLHPPPMAATVEAHTPPRCCRHPGTVAPEGGGPGRRQQRAVPGRRQRRGGGGAGIRNAAPRVRATPPRRRGRRAVAVGRGVGVAAAPVPRRRRLRQTGCPRDHARAGIVAGRGPTPRRWGRTPSAQWYDDAGRGPHPGQASKTRDGPRLAPRYPDAGRTPPHPRLANQARDGPHRRLPNKTQPPSQQDTTAPNPG